MRVATFLLFALVALTSSAASAQARYDYLIPIITTANEIYEIKRSSLTLKDEEVLKIATRACKTLDQLLEHEGFHDDLNKLAAASGQHATYHRRLAKDFNLFTKSFLKDEGALLQQAGVSDKASKQILHSARALQSSLSGRLDSKTVLEHTRNLRADICKAAGTLEKQQLRWKRVKQWGSGFGGLALIVVDAGALPVTAGTATASGIVGGAMLQQVMAP